MLKESLNGCHREYKANGLDDLDPSIGEFGIEAAGTVNAFGFCDDRNDGAYGLEDGKLENRNPL